MASFSHIARLTPLPIVDLQRIECPVDGLLFDVPACCKRHFSERNKCRAHYESLKSTGIINEIVQCPYGFSSMKINLDGQSIALTCFVPSPRQGGKTERQVAKSNPEVKLSRDSLPRISKSLADFDQQLSGLEESTLKNQSMALHEIRKLNREVKQNAERLCHEASPGAPDNADARLVNIWKASDIMSGQFAALELLANEQLADLPPNSVSEIYRIFDKCARIYNRGEAKWRIIINAPHGFNARIRVCDKTFPIIPTVLIENALKYSLPNSEINIDLTYGPGRSRCIASVTNSVNPLFIPENTRIDHSVFEKGRRVAIAGEGSGNGLYLAKLITQQHSGSIYVSERLNTSTGFRTVSFTVNLPCIIA